jgi:putative addiction module killer protein
VFQLRHYLTADGVGVFNTLLERLADTNAVARITGRIDRLQAGNFGDHKPVGGGVWELRVNRGPVYRVYYAIAGRRLVLLLCGGDKRKQSSDIRRAITLLHDCKSRKPKP